MIAPTVHLNGTSKGALLEQLAQAIASIGGAMAALAEATPDGRDYYVQGPSALGDALGAHGLRQRKLLEVKQELMEIYEAVDAQGGRR